MKKHNAANRDINHNRSKLQTAESLPVAEETRKKLRKMLIYVPIWLAVENNIKRTLSENNTKAAALWMSLSQELYKIQSEEREIIEEYRILKSKKKEHAEKFHADEAAFKAYMKRNKQKRIGSKVLQKTPYHKEVVRDLEKQKEKFSEFTRAMKLAVKKINAKKKYRGELKITVDKTRKLWKLVEEAYESRCLKTLGTIQSSIRQSEEHLITAPLSEKEMMREYISMLKEHEISYAYEDGYLRVGASC